MRVAIADSAVEVNANIGNQAIQTMTESFEDVLQYRDLLYMLPWRDIKARYKQSMMGLFWAIVMPMLIVPEGVLERLAAVSHWNV